MPVSAQNRSLAAGVLTVAAVSFTQRNVKGSTLTHTEVDNNWSAVQAYMVIVATSTGTGTDFLSRISNMTEGDSIMIRPASGSTIVVSHGNSGGLLRLGGGVSFTLSSVYHCMQFRQVESSILIELSRSDNA